MPTCLGLVFIVDDDAAVRDAIRFSLDAEGIETRVFASAAAFLREPDLPSRACLVIDYAMPDMNGIELLKELSRREIRIPSILMVTQPDRDLWRRAKAAGADTVLEKPLSDGALLDRIRGALRG